MIRSTKLVDETNLHVRLKFVETRKFLNPKSSVCRLDFSEFLHVMATHELTHTKESLGWAHVHCVAAQVLLITNKKVCCIKSYSQIIAIAV